MPAPSTIAAGREGMRALLPFLDQRCAVFCGSDLMAFGVVTEARMQGIPVPDQLAVCGFGNMELSEMNEPPITTVSLEGVGTGRSAASFLLRRLAGEARATAIGSRCHSASYNARRPDPKAGAFFAASICATIRGADRNEKTPVCPPAAASAMVGGFARPAIVRAASATTLKFVPYADLALLDPLISAFVTRNHVMMVFDTLFALDADGNPQHQMLAGHTVDADQKVWTLTLRDGLLFHDGTSVISRDVVASLRRWGTTDAFGQALMAATDELSAPNDQTVVFRLKRPFALLPQALAKPTAPMAVVMPERLANTPPGKRITEMVGSGPFRFLPNERVPGARNAYAKFDKYARARASRVSAPARASPILTASNGSPHPIRLRKPQHSKPAKSIGSSNR